MLDTVEVAQVLVKASAKTDLQEREKCTQLPCLHPLMKGRIEVVQLLVEAGLIRISIRSHEGRADAGGSKFSRGNTSFVTGFMPASEWLICPPHCAVSCAICSIKPGIPPAKAAKGGTIGPRSLKVP